jgi:DNA-binding beta-propeller fold protein YncE
VADECAAQVIRLGSNAAVSFRRSNFVLPASVSTNQTDGSCWVADTGNDRVRHLSLSGSLIAQVPGLTAPSSVSVNSNDGSCWIADTGGNAVAHVGSDGLLLRRSTIFLGPLSVAASPVDGSCWVADTGNKRVVHLSPDAAQLFAGGLFTEPVAVAVNPNDGSCWVSDATLNVVVHLSATGVELSRSTGFDDPRGLAVSPLDGSCWVADRLNNQVVRLAAADGSVMLEAGGFTHPEAVSVDPATGFCWVADTDNDLVVNISRTGQVLAEVEGFVGPASLSARGSDSSCWVADTANSQVARLLVTAPPAPIFPDVAFTAFGHDEIDACVAAGIVQGFEDGNFQPNTIVTRDQMAVFIARAVAGGDSNVPDGPPTATFSDVPTTHWAFKYIEFVAEANIAKGFDDGTFQPLEQVDRAQMSAFIARSIVTPTGDDGLVGFIPPTEPTFPDVPTDFWAFKYVEFLSEQNVVKGFGDGLYHPEVMVDRAQMAVFIFRAFKLPL